MTYWLIAMFGIITGGNFGILIAGDPGWWNWAGLAVGIFGLTMAFYLHAQRNR